MDSQTQLNDHPNIKKVVSMESFVFLAIFLAVFGLLASKMGMINMLNTMMQTAYQLLLDTVFYIMAIAVLAGALSGLFTEFGIVAIINKVLSPLMKPVYDLPGASVVGILATYLSDNPAILTLAEDQGFRRYFKPAAGIDQHRYRFRYGSDYHLFHGGYRFSDRRKFCSSGTDW